MKRRTQMIILDFALRSVLGLLVALPVVATVAGTTVGHFPEGDRLLFAPGGVYLAEVVRVLLPVLPPLLATSLSTTLAFSLLLLVPHAALLVALSETEEAERREFWGRALARVPTLLAVTAVALLAELAVLLVFVGLAGTAGGAVGGERAGDLASAAVLLLGVVLAVGVGLARDLARAAAVVGDLDGPGALRRGLRTLLTEAPRAIPAWLGPALLSVMVVAAAALFTGALDASRPEPWRGVLILLVHQGAALALTWCRALWLSSCVDLAAGLRRPS
jgi:hypothetical protein